MIDPDHQVLLVAGTPEVAMLVAAILEMTGATLLHRWRPLPPAGLKLRKMKNVSPTLILHHGRTVDALYHWQLI